MTDELLELTTKLAKELRQLTDKYRRGRITFEEWKQKFAELLTVATLVAAMEGYGEEDIPQQLVQAVTETVAVQLGFLNRFDAQIQTSPEFDLAWLDRAETYANAIKVPYWQGKTKILPLPAMPAQGTQCLNNCKCKWDIRPVTRGGRIVAYRCYWVRAADDSCQTCIQRERDWNPILIDIIDGIAVLRPTLSTKEVGSTEKHLAGQHDQQSHAGGKGGARDVATIEREVGEARRVVYSRMREARASGDYSGISQLRSRVRGLERELEAARSSPSASGGGAPPAESEAQRAERIHREVTASNAAYFARLNQPKVDEDGELTGPLDGPPGSRFAIKPDTKNYDPAGIYKQGFKSVAVMSPMGGDDHVGALKAKYKERTGKDLTTEDIAAVVGAPDGAIVTVSMYNNSAYLSVSHPSYDGTQERVLNFPSYGDGPTIKNSYFALDPSAPKGMGTSIFNRQVQEARRLGFKRIETYAAQGYNPETGGQYNGYYTWPRLGYDGPISAAEGYIDTSGFPGVSRVSDLMKTPEGRKFWEKNGSGIYLEFDLAEGSLSSYILDAYVTEKMNGG